MHLATSVLIVLVTIGAASAHAQERERTLDAAYRHRREGNVAEARRAFETALANGEGDEQRIHLELGYLERQAGNLSSARNHFERAGSGPDPELVERARNELRYIPTYVWADIYFEGFGWHRFVGRESTNFVPTLRLRGLVRPFLEADVSIYAYGQITRDVASRDNTPSGLPLIYADNHALVGGGVLARFFEGRVGVYAQMGPAFNLLNDGRDRVSFDARVGVNGGIDNTECRASSFDGVRALVGPCIEGYGEITYVSRFNHDVIAMLRGRAGYGLLQTGPVLWQPLIEIRALGGINGDYYNNFAEAGAGHRWRLIEPFVADVILTLHGGAYYGVERIDPVPNPPYYLEGRLLITSYVEVR